MTNLLHQIIRQRQHVQHTTANGQHPPKKRIVENDIQKMDFLLRQKERNRQQFGVVDQQILPQPRHPLQSWESPATRNSSSTDNANSISTIP